MPAGRRVRAWAGLALLAATGAALATAEVSRPFLGGHLQESRVLYPLQVDEWLARDEHRYERAELGASVRYQFGDRADRWMDLYVYPAGVQLEPSFAETFRHEVGQVEGARRQRGDRIDTGDTHVFEAPGEFDALLGELSPRPRSATFVFETGGKRYHSLIALGIRDLYLVKLRYSAEDDVLSLADMRQQGETFLAGFLATLQVFNSGDCARTPQVNPIAEGATRPDALLASANDGTADEVWVGDDAVWLRPDALADEAARERLLALATSLHAALRGRCLPPEEMDVEVPEGMREMRFEYRLPTRPGAQPRLRVPTRADS